MLTRRLRHRRQWFDLRWPHEVEQEDVLSALMRLNGYSTPRHGHAMVMLAVGQGRRVTHYLSVPTPRAEGVRHQMEAAVPGLTANPLDTAPALRVDRCWGAWLSSRQRPLETRHPDVLARGLLTALGSAGDDELLVARWVLGPVHRPRALNAHNQLRRALGVPADSLHDVAATGHRRGTRHSNSPELDGEARRAWSQKQGRSGWRAALHLGVRARGTRRQRQLLGRLAAGFRTAQAAGAHIGFRVALTPTLSNHRLPLRRPLLVTIDELHGLAGWPIGDTETLPVAHERSRLLPPSPTPTSDRVLAEATYPGGGLLTLSPRDALHHLHLCGPTGVGKSTLMARLILHDIAAGRGVVVVEPRRDLLDDVLARIPEHRLDDVVVIDPTDAAPVGINPLAARGVPADLKAEHLLTVFQHLWADSWGPRTQDILTAGLLTLAAVPGSSLVALPALYSNAAFRHRVLRRVHDPLALDSFWAEFEEKSPEQRAHELGPVRNKLRAFTLRPRLRRVIGQSHPRFDLRDIFRRRMVVLATLAQGAMGSESSYLLGALLLTQLWQTAQSRSSIPREKRHPVMLYLDEFQRYLHLPTDLSEVLAEARALGLGVTLAHQHLGQLTSDLQATVGANARSKVVFATNHEDAYKLTRGSSRLTAVDVVRLGRYDVYASLMVEGEPTPWASGRTLELPPPARSPADVIQRSRRAWGVPGHSIDAEVQELIRGGRLPDDQVSPVQRGHFVTRPDARPNRR